MSLNLRRELERRKGERDQVKSSLQDCTRKLKHAKRALKKHEQAREVVRSAGLATQQQLEFHFSDIVTSALQAVFPDPYSLSVKFVERRGKTECDLGFERDGLIIDPLSAAGGGVVDVASFALRAASWAMQSPRPRAVLILDEPFRYLSTDLQGKAGEMLREISDKLGVQMLIVTHEEELMECADHVFEVQQRKGVTHISS